jgi:hypothetical protein
MSVANYDNARERAELRGINPAEVSHLTLGRGGVNMEIYDRNLVMALMFELRGIRNIPDHRSRPTDLLDLEFEYQQRPYHYRIGRDSHRPQEFWIQGAGGRINSTTFGPLIDTMLAQPYRRNTP